MATADGIRTATRDDMPAIRALIESNEMFPGEMLDAMMAPFFGGADELWFVVGDAPSAVAYAVPEKLTNGTWNQLLIAVDPARHGKGIGTALMRHLEEALCERGMRMIVVDTSGTEAFAATRAFYRSIGYEEVARIPDFWDSGNDKVTFRRELVR